MTDPEASIVYITAADRAEALRIARALVEERLAASVNVIDGLTSVYRWRGVVAEAAEAALVAKTRTERVPEIVDRVKQLHSYECPCIVAWPIAQGSPDYLAWLWEQTGPE